jgi:hypothetical protein
MTSHWNYRILARNINNEIQYAIYEVHYENDIPKACTQNPVYPLGFASEEPVDSIKWQLDAMRSALDKPVLDYDNFPIEYIDNIRLKKLLQIDEFFKNFNVDDKV